MEFSVFKTLVIEEAKKLGIEQYELYYSSEDSTSVSIFNGDVQDFTAGLSGGVAFRCIVDGHLGCAYTQAMSEEQAVRLVKSAYGNAKVLEKEEPAYFAEGNQEYPTYDAENMPILSGAELIEKGKSAAEILQNANPMMTNQGRVQVASGSEEICLVNSNGVDISSKNCSDMMLMIAVVSDGKESNNEYAMKCADLTTFDPTDFAKETAESAASKLGAGVAPTAVCPVVFSAGAMCSLLATYSGAFSADNARKGLSFLAGKEGQMIASEKVTIIDDPFFMENPARRNFDGEGSPTFKKTLIKNGKLETLLYDLATAKAEGKQTTGNGMRADYTSPVTIRPFTMALAGGELTEEEVFAKAGNGVYITSLGGLHAGANPISGDFSLQSAGFMIEDGKKGRPVRSFTVSGNFFEMLTKITELSNEVKIPHAGSLTAFAAPAVLVSELTIAGE